MSGLGHLAPGLVAKSTAPKVPLWVFLLVGETNDLLYFAFTAIGIEKPAAITMDFNQGVRYLTQGSIPWSHGFFMSVVWSVLAAGIALLFWRDRRVSFLLGIVVFSHWALDFLMHFNLPLFFDGSPLVGLGLENSGQGFLFITIFDIVILAAGIAVYFRAKSAGGTPSRAEGGKSEL
ncbi:MAG: DUF3292 domain-containing protein [Anaerolineales bacterium]|nr:DUF3292 domain-containing protein [Anaerolineales bacterium]